MHWLWALVGLMACGPAVEIEDSRDTGETLVEDSGDTGEPLPELPVLQNRVEGVTVVSMRYLDRPEDEWVDLGTAYLGEVLVIGDAFVGELVWSSDHCDLFHVAWAYSEEGLSPLGLHTSRVEATATYQDQRYVLQGLDRSPFAAEDSLLVTHEEEELVEVPAPPDIDEELMGEPEGLSTLLRIPHDDFDAVQVVLLDPTAPSTEHDTAYCLYGKRDMTWVDGAWELPLVDEASREPLASLGGDVMVSTIHLEMTEALFPDHAPVPVKAGRGVVFSSSALFD